MEELQKDGGQSPNLSDSEPELMVIDDDGEEKFHNMDEGSNDSPIHVDEGQSSMDVDVKGKTSLDDESRDDDVNGKSSSNPCSNVPIDVSVESLEKFCKEASRSFFDEIGLISHQINSYNEFVSHGLQELFDSLGEVIVDPGYDPSKKVSGSWKHAIIKFGRVKLEKPVFLSGKDEVDIDLKPRHARLQNMTYASKIKVEVTIQVYSLEKSDKSKTGNDGFVQKRDFMNETHWIYIGRLPVMVKSDLCLLHSHKESDCLFDAGGYFLVKGMEKV
jgi:DNA-directed RNA polymerase-4/5 subunit 2